MKSKKKKRIIIFSILGAIIVIFIVFFALGRSKMSKITLQTAVASTDSLEITVTATGEIQPVYKVDVGTQVSGIVEKIYVDFNSEVKKGDLLAELDRSTLQEQVNQAEANLSNAQSNLTLAEQNYERIKSLFDNKAATQTSYEEATNQYIQAKNKVLTASSDLQRAQVNLSYAHIYSPISGVVLNKVVEQGQTVAASFSTPTLFTIANDLTQMQVEANVDEADIGQVKVHQRVTFTVDAFPEDVFEGEVSQIRLEPVVTSNVVTYTVIITAANPEEKLFPGMTASVNIIVNKQSGVAIPMESIFFTLSEEARKQLTNEGCTFKDLFANQDDLTNSLKDISTKSIWVQNGKNYEERLIKLGLNDGATLMVNEGLNVGETVVVAERKMLPPKAEKGQSIMPGPPERRTR